VEAEKQMNDQHPTRDSMSLEEATFSNMWEIEKAQELAGGYP
jgi:hypothetical protein